MDKNQTDAPGERLSNMVKTAEKKWADCSIEEKIERLREEQMNARWTMRHAFKLGRKAWRAVCNHQHNPATGQVLQSIEEHGGGSEGDATAAQDRLA